MGQVLEGVRVLDFGRFIAGPFCATLLADMGADVIRVERLAGGEDRYLTPVTDDGQGALFQQVGRNKRSLTLRPTVAEGREVLERLVATADVVVANMPPKSLAALGLDYASLCAVKPDIILTSNTAFGLGGPWSDRVGFDGLAQAMSGVAHLSGTEEQPTRAIAPFVDFCTASLCAFATLAALWHRRETGEGQEVQGALLKTALTMMGSQLVEQDQLQIDRVATLNRGQTNGPSDIFRTNDGWVMGLVIGPHQFERWCRMVGAEELLEDERFADDLKRGENGEELSKKMAAWCAERSVDEALAAMEAAKLPAGPVLSPQQALDHEHVRALDFLQTVEHPDAGSGDTEKTMRIPGPPVHLTRTPGTIRRRAPRLGEHSDEILRELGYDESGIEALRAAGAV